MKKYRIFIFYYGIYPVSLLCNTKIQRIMQETINVPKTRKVKKSVSLTDKELANLNAFVARFKTQIEAALMLGIDRNVLNRVLAYGSGHETSIKKIRQNLPK